MAYAAKWRNKAPACLSRSPLTGLYNLLFAVEGHNLDLILANCNNHHVRLCLSALISQPFSGVFLSQQISISQSETI
jgi:hypothetical protein